MARAGTVQIGKWRWPPKMGGGTAVISFKSGAKLDKKESDGKDDARTTYKGRKPCDGKITLTWVDSDGLPADHPLAGVDEAAVAMLRDLSPRGPNGGKPWEFASKDSEIHDVRSIMIEDLDGPKRTPGTSQVTAEIAFSSWSKPTATAKGAGVGKTPKQAEAWSQQADWEKAYKEWAAKQGFAGPDAPKVEP